MKSFFKAWNWVTFEMEGMLALHTTPKQENQGLLSGYP
jgi:hypothetical protein